MSTYSLNKRQKEKTLPGYQLSVSTPTALIPFAPWSWIPQASIHCVSESTRPSKQTYAPRSLTP